MQILKWLPEAPKVTLPALHLTSEHGVMERRPNPLGGPRLVFPPLRPGQSRPAALANYSAPLMVSDLLIRFIAHGQHKRSISFPTFRHRISGTAPPSSSPS